MTETADETTGERGTAQQGAGPKSGGKLGAWYRQPEMLIGLSALVVSLVAVFVGVYSAYIDRAFARASVWPRLEIYRGFDTEPMLFRYSVNNSGTGPAIIRYATVTVDGEPVKNWQQVIEGLHGAPAPLTQSHIGSRTLAAEKVAEVLRVTEPEVVRSLLEDESARVGIELCYCSIFDDCWLVDRTNAPEPVERCVVGEEARFQQ